MRKSRRIAGLLAAMGLGVGMIGVGVHASFTDSGNAQASVATGTFAITLHSDAAGVTGNDTKALSLNGGTLLSSAPGSKDLPFRVDNKGTMPAVVTITADRSGLTSEFSDKLAGTPIVVTVPAGGSSVVYAGGMSWGDLTNASLSKTETVKYVVSAVDH